MLAELENQVGSIPNDEKPLLEDFLIRWMCTHSMWGDKCGAFLTLKKLWGETIKKEAWDLIERVVLFRSENNVKRLAKLEKMNNKNINKILTMIKGEAGTQASPHSGPKNKKQQAVRLVY